MKLTTATFNEEMDQFLAKIELEKAINRARKLGIPVDIKTPEASKKLPVNLYVLDEEEVMRYALRMMVDKTNE